MGILKWDARYSVQNDQMDDQHQKLFDFVNELFDHSKAQNDELSTEQILDSLVKFTMVHFHSEEKLMKQYNFPGLNEHKLEHVNLIERIREFQNQIQGGETELSIRVSNFLREWLENHILISDIKYSKHIKSIEV